MKKVMILFLAYLGFHTIAEAQTNLAIDYQGFQGLTTEVYAYRQSRLIQIDEFNKYAQEENTIILDTRSRQAFEQIHIAGAVHLNFSDFTKEALAKVIPNKNTRILIYCNNNFESKSKALAGKLPPLALNIPTFINLYGYGYKNVYELKDYLDIKDPRLNLFGNTVLK